MVNKKYFHANPLLQTDLKKVHFKQGPCHAKPLLQMNPYCKWIPCNVQKSIWIECHKNHCPSSACSPTYGTGPPLTKRSGLSWAKESFCEQSWTNRTVLITDALFQPFKAPWQLCCRYFRCISQKALTSWNFELWRAWTKLPEYPAHSQDRHTHQRLGRFIAWLAQWPTPGP